MLGLALGGTWAPGGPSACVGRPGLWCCGIGIGLCAAVVTVVLPHLESVDSVGLRYLVAALCLVLPSTLMGLDVSLGDAGCDPGGRGGGWRTVPPPTRRAHPGCMLAGFLGIRWPGRPRHRGIAVAGNLLCGLTALLLFSAGFVAAAYHAPSTAPRPSRQPDRPARAAAGVRGCGQWPAPARWALRSSGRASSYLRELIQLRPLGHPGHLPGRSGFGCDLGGPSLRPAVVVPDARLFGLFATWAGVLVWATPRLLRVAETLVPATWAIRQITSLAGGLAMMAGVFAKAAIVVLVPLSDGASLPLCIAQMARTGLAGGAAAGRVVALNTVGGVAGFRAGRVSLRLAWAAARQCRRGLGNSCSAAARGRRPVWQSASGHGSRSPRWVVLLPPRHRHPDAPPFLGMSFFSKCGSGETRN